MTPEMQALLDSGHVTQNQDGTFKISEELRDFLIKKIEDNPALYSELFPDRLN